MAELRNEDLFHDCPRCKGTKLVQTEPSTPGFAMEPIQCPACKGLGIELTATGKVLADFMERLRRRS
jgi:hypothetical protein